MNRYPPLILTYKQLEAAVWPIIAYDGWGKDTIGDLWRMGAPTPESTPQNEKRIVFPSQLMKWLSDVLQRQGRPLDDMAKVLAITLQESM